MALLILGNFLVKIALKPHFIKLDFLKLIFVKF